MGLYSWYYLVACIIMTLLVQQILTSFEKREQHFFVDAQNSFRVSLVKQICIPKAPILICSKLVYVPKHIRPGFFERVWSCDLQIFNQNAVFCFVWSVGSSFILAGFQMDDHVFCEIEIEKKNWNCHRENINLDLNNSTMS